MDDDKTPPPTLRAVGPQDEIEARENADPTPGYSISLASLRAYRDANSTTPEEISRSWRGRPDEEIATDILHELLASDLAKHRLLRMTAGEVNEIATVGNQIRASVRMLGLDRKSRPISKSAEPEKKANKFRRFRAS